MKTIRTICLLSICLFINPIVAATLPTPNVTKEQSLDRIVATVNDDIIMQSQFDHALKAAKQQFEQHRIPLPDEATFKKQVLDQLIYQKLQLQVAARNHITATKQELNDAIKHIAAQNRLTVAQLKEKLSESGIPYQTFRDQIQKQLIVTKVQQQALGSTITINKSDIAAFRAKHQSQINPTQYHVASVVIPISDSATPAQINAAKRKATAEFKKLKEGDNFNQAMSTYPDSVDLGWRSRSDLPQLFIRPVTSMKPGDIVGPLQAPNGFHIIKLLGKQQKGKGLTDQQIYSALFQQKAGPALQKWLTQLRQAAYVHINSD